MATITPISSSTPELTPWTRTVHSVAARARATFPSLGGRIERALELVLAGDVECLGPQSYRVACQSDPSGLKTYEVTTGRRALCTCEDFQQHLEDAQAHHCKHVLAVWILRRAQAEGEPTAAPEPTPAPAGTPCPEAAFSLCMQGLLDGHQAQLTVRGQTPAEFQANLAVVRGLFDAPTPALARHPGTPAPVPTAAGEVRYCPVHGTPMQINVNAKGSWWSHKQGDVWCKGKTQKG